ncbi:MAG: outer membrane protein transport protein [Pseudomonadota bacterium]
MGFSSTIKTAVMGAVTSSLLTSAAVAGGFDRGGVNIDQLFDKDRLSANARVTYVSPRRTIQNITRVGPGGPLPIPGQGASVDVDSNYVVPRFGAKLNIGEGFDCLASYAEPYGADAGYGTGNVYSPSAVRFFLDTEDYGLTCSYQFGAGSTSLGDGYARIIGGFSYLEADGFLSRQSLLFGAAPIPGVRPGLPPNPGLATFSISDNTYGWRAGVAYEIPDIALNATILYNSKYDLEFSGVQDTTGFGAGHPLAGILPINLFTEIPQSLEVKLQTGINESTLAFLNMKWQDWSQLQIIPVINAITGTPTGSTLDLSYQDGYTVTAGIGRKLSENVSVLTSLTWDRGTSTIVGTQSDTWTLAGGIRYKEGDNFRVSVGGAIGILEGGASGINAANPDPAGGVVYSYEADIVYAITASAKYRF